MSAVPAPSSTSAVVGALLVGSVNLPDAETVFTTVSENLGDHLGRIPDGEVGDRFNWISFQTNVFDKTPGLARIPIAPIEVNGFDYRPFLLEESADPAQIEFPDLGYASAARESYEIFKRLRDAGVIRPGTRFQVSLPTPVAPVNSFFIAEVKGAVEPAYQRAILHELSGILETVPAHDLAIQWDVAVEFGLIEGAEYPGVKFEPWWEGDVIEGCTTRVAEVANHVPEGVELGFHFCYGDLGETHFKEPKDTDILTRTANSLFPKVTRSVQWLHLPVPIDRDDQAYYQALRSLELPAGTELYLGLVHREDGPEGAGRRIAAAQSSVSKFGVATECGFGRSPRESTIPLLQTHAQVAAPVHA